jgi:hypothetical protein
MKQVDNPSTVMGVIQYISIDHSLMTDLQENHRCVGW